MRRAWQVVVGLIVVVALAAGAVWVYLAYYAGQGDRIEQWVGSQVQGMINSRLNPQLHWQSLKYQYPTGVILEGVRLVASPSEAPQHTVEILSAEQVEMELAQIPKVGQPIKLEKVLVTRPHVELIATEQGEFEFLGYSDLVKSKDEQPEQQTPLSEVLQITLIELNNASIRYDTRREDQPPMTVDQIDLRVDIDPESGGRYVVDTTLQRQPLFTLEFNGSLDVDDRVVQAERAQLRMTIDESTKATLPPQVQQLIDEHQVTGDMTLTASDVVAPLSDWRTSTGTIDLELNDAFVSMDEYRLPVESLQAQFAVADRRARIEQFLVQTLGGELTADGGVDLTDPLQGQFTFRADGLSLEQALAAKQSDGSAKYVGLIDAEVLVQGPLEDMRTQAYGEGQWKLYEARLTSIPVLSTIISVLGKARDVALGRESKPNDSAEGRFSLQGDHAHVVELKARDRWFAVRAFGDVYFDGRLDLKVAAGPVEKIQELFGGIGDLFGKITESIQSYRVTGTVQEPKVNVVVGGIGIGRAEPVEHSPASATLATAVE